MYKLLGKNALIFLIFARSLVESGPRNSFAVVVVVVVVVVIRVKCFVPFVQILEYFIMF